MNDLRKFKEIFRKGVSEDNIKSHKKQGFSLSLEDTLFKKLHGEAGRPPPAVLGLKQFKQ